MRVPVLHRARIHVPADSVMRMLRTGLLGLMVGACGGAPSAGAGRDDVPSGSATGLAYATDVVILERAEGEALLRSIGEEGWVLVFDGDTEKLRSLRRGQTLFIRDLLARKVIASRVDGTQVALLTEPAAITDILTDGRLQFTYPAHFTRSGVRAAAPRASSPWTSGGPRPSSPWSAAAAWLVPAAHAAVSAGDEPHWETVTREINQWVCTFSVTPEDGRLRIRLALASKYEKVLDLKIEADGYLENFTVAGDILVEQSRTQRLELAARQMTGSFDVRWTISHNVAERLLKNETIQLPAALSIPLAQFVGGIPLSLDISAAMMIKPAFSTSHQASTGSVRVEFGGDQSFVVSDGVIDPGGDLDASMELVESVNISPRAGLGLVIAFAAPRFDLSLGAKNLVPGLGKYIEQGKLADAAAELLVYEAFGESAAQLVRTAGIGKALGEVSSTTAAAWFAMNTTVGIFRSSEASMLPCERHWLIVSGSVGVKANLLGEKTATAPAEVLKRERTIVEPDTPFCRSAG